MHLGEALDKLFSEFADDHAVSVYGEPSPELLQMASRMPPGSVKWYCFLRDWKVEHVSRRGRDQALMFLPMMDVRGAEFTHEGEACTLETILRRFGLNHNQSLRETGEIVHDIHLKDDKFHRLEAAGLNTAINALSKVLSDDRKLFSNAG